MEGSACALLFLVGDLPDKRPGRSRSTLDLTAFDETQIETARYLVRKHQRATSDCASYRSQHAQYVDRAVRNPKCG